MQGGRPKAREIVFRVLFETEVSGEDLLETLEYALSRYHLTSDGRDYAIHLVDLLESRREEIDALIVPRLERWSFERISVAVRAVLRRATAELLGADDVPRAVIIDQAIATAKRYGEDGSDAFINGVLDRLAEQVRAGEQRRVPSSRPTPTKGA